MSAPTPQTGPADGGGTPPEKKFTPFVPENTDLKEFTWRALVLGLVMTVILGAANAYLGLRAGMTIAATYPAAVIGMAVLRIFRGSILEENMARTVGSIGESIAAGAVFTIPAFVIAGAWDGKDGHPAFGDTTTYLQSSALMVVGGLLGILFVTLLRRVMVEDKDLPFPESVAAAEIHKAGQKGLGAAKNLLQAMGIGAVAYLLGKANLFAASRSIPMFVGRVCKGVADECNMVKLVAKATTGKALGVGGGLKLGGHTTFDLPSISPAYLGVGYIIGPALGALNFAGGLLAWGLFVPLLVFFLGAHTEQLLTAEFLEVAAKAGKELTEADAIAKAQSMTGLVLWKSIVRPIAVGGMLVGAATTLYKMRKNLISGMKRAVSDLRKSTAAQAQTGRLDRDLSMKIVFPALAVVSLLVVAVYLWFTGHYTASIVSAAVMIVTGFFFAAVSGNLVGLIGSSNNPISGLTVSTLIIAALLMVVLGITGAPGVVAVLGVAAIVCISAAVAGEMLQDLKVGHILGGTPSKMQAGNIVGIVVASAAMFFPLVLLHKTMGGLGGSQLPAPQASLMAMLAQGIVGGQMSWALVLVGILMGLAFVLVQVKSPMLVSVGMYLPLETTAAIFVGGVIRWITDKVGARRAHNPAQKARTENAGVLVAAGLIAGEALMGLGVAGYLLIANREEFPVLAWGGANWMALPVLVGLALLMIYKPLGSAGSPDEPPPPTAVM